MNKKILIGGASVAALAYGLIASHGYDPSKNYIVTLSEQQK